MHNDRNALWAGSDSWATVSELGHICISIMDCIMRIGSHKWDWAGETGGPYIVAPVPAEIGSHGSRPTCVT
ncbi:hypothetical protein HanIR_Chr12g0589421 [Helianthus annuus]|nr:hypothetical protein HanIR_Chr12g0589421 [Helianthus annuus]